MKRGWLIALAFAASAGLARAETPQIVIEAAKVTPKFLTTITGEQVKFLNRSGSSVHVEFGDDVRQHHVVQVPVTGPIWAIFHRPGTHPYVVHVYDHGTKAIAGTVDVIEDEAHKWDARTCGAVIVGECIER